MNVYIFKAAMLCEECGRRVCETTPPPAGADLDNESTWDSDAYPKGPYANGGGESDSPHHCDHCAAFLENPLTPNGDTYVREQASEFAAPEACWSEVADCAEAAKQHVLAEWIRFYLAPGM